jgi:hypothetical protein
MKPKTTRWVSKDDLTLYLVGARERRREREKKNYTEDQQIWKTYRCLRLNHTETFHARRFVGD